MAKQEKHKAVIETIINSSAIALSGLGVINVQQGDYLGLLLISFAAGLEFLKYWGRQRKLW